MVDEKQQRAPTGGTNGKVTVEDQTHTLVRIYLIAGWVTLVFLVTVIGLVIRQAAVTRLIADTEASSIAIARAFAGVVGLPLRDHARRAADMTDDELRAHPDAERLEAMLLAQIEGQPVVRFRVYGEGARIIAASTRDEVGRYAADAVVLEMVAGRWYGTAVSGTATALIRGDEDTAPNDTARDRRLVSTRVPIPRAGLDVEAVIEIVQDITPVFRRIVRTQLLGTGGVALVSALLLALALRRETANRGARDKE